MPRIHFKLFLCVVRWHVNISFLLQNMWKQCHHPVAVVVLPQRVHFLAFLYVLLISQSLCLSISQSVFLSSSLTSLLWLVTMLSLSIDFSCWTYMLYLSFQSLLFALQGECSFVASYLLCSLLFNIYISMCSFVIHHHLHKHSIFF